MNVSVPILVLSGSSLETQMMEPPSPRPMGQKPGWDMGSLRATLMPLSASCWHLSLRSLGIGCPTLPLMVSSQLGDDGHSCPVSTQKFAERTLCSIEADLADALGKTWGKDSRGMHTYCLLGTQLCFYGVSVSVSTGYCLWWAMLRRESLPIKMWPSFLISLNFYFVYVKRNFGSLFSDRFF